MSALAEKFTVGQMGRAIAVIASVMMNGDNNNRGVYTVLDDANRIATFIRTGEAR